MGLRLMGDLGVLWAGPDVSFLRGGEQRGGEGEALTCSAFQGIPGLALVGGAGEKPLQVSGSPQFSVEAPLPALPLTLPPVALA